MFPEDEDEFFEPHDDEVEDTFEEEEELEESDSPEISALREDKIFNNRYNTGDGLADPDDYQFSRGISVDRDYSDSYLKDLYEYEDKLQNNFILDSIFKFVHSDELILQIIKSTANDPFITKCKLSKEDINFIFNRINTSLNSTSNSTIFYSPIYILEAISSISSIEYKKIFDSLDTEIQEILLIELNKKYFFLDGKMHKKKIH